MGWLAALISAGAEVGQAYLNKELTSQLNKENTEIQHHYWDIQNDKTFAQNEQAAENADARARALYNDIQSPEAMKKQLLDAGLNPALMYSQGGMGGHVQQGAQGAGSGNAQGVSTLGLQNFINASNIANTMKTFAETKNIEADTKNKEEENKNIAKDTEVKETLRLLNNQTLSQNERRFIEEITIMLLQQANIEQDTETKLADKFLKDEQTNSEKTRKEILNNEKLMTDIDLEFKKLFKEKGIDLNSMPGIASLIIQLGNKGKELLDKWLGNGWEMEWPKDLKFWQPQNYKQNP